MTSTVREVSGAEHEALAGWLGDRPETAMSNHRLRRGLGRGLVLGAADQPEAAIVQAHLLPSEPAGFGDDPERLWSVLRLTEGWEAVHVDPALAPPLAVVIERETGRVGPLIEEPYYLLTRPVVAHPHPEVRRLTQEDIPAIEAATRPLDMRGWRYGSAAALVSDGYIAGAIVSGELVAIGFSSNRSARYAEVGIVTRADHRNRGLSTATAALVCADAQRLGLIPVWSTGEDNLASQRVGAKLGFVEVSRRVYVNRT